MATRFTVDFARLVPYNHDARILFSRSYVYAEKNNTFHLRFMNSTDSELLPASDEVVESSTDYETHADTDTEISAVRSNQSLGYFVLSFHEGRVPEMLHLGWRAGRGTSKLPNRNVDILLASKGDNRGRSLASVHMVFRFNPRSGFLMLMGGTPRVPVELKTNGAWKALEFDEEQLIHQPVTMLRAGTCEYELEYTVEETHREAYFEQRDSFLGVVQPGTDKPQRAFQRLPGDHCVIRGNYVEFDTQGSGTFGWITRGIDITTGDPVAIKELRIRSKKDRLQVEAEASVGNQFLVR